MRKILCTNTLQKTTFKPFVTLTGGEDYLLLLIRNLTSSTRSHNPPVITQRKTLNSRDAPLGASFYVWQDEKMQEYARKSTAYIVELTNGDIIALDKPRIETRFCFGHGYCGRTTEEDEKRAYNMAEYAATNQEYFINENIKGLEEKIKDLRDTRLKAYTYTAYSGQPEKSKLKNYTLASLCYTPEYNPAYYANLKDLKEITMKDRERIAAGLEKVKADFVKRLNTYLKRYGLTKVRTWTYLSD